MSLENMSLSDKVSYLMGLMDGFEIDESTKEGRVLRGLTEVVKELVTEVADNSERIDDIQELAETLDYDLGELEESVIEIEDAFDEIAELMCDCDDDCDDDDCGCISYRPSRFDEDIDGQIYEVVCPKCNNQLLLDEDDLKLGKLNCPKCKELLEFDIEV